MMKGWQWREARQRNTRVGYWVVEIVALVANNNYCFTIVKFGNRIPYYLLILRIIVKPVEALNKKNHESGIDFVFMIVIS